MSAAPPEPVLLSWSGGKDSAMALHRLRADPAVRVVALLTTVAAEFGRVSHHGVRQALLEAQAAAVGVPLDVVSLPAQVTNAAYEAVMEERMHAYRARGVHTVAFGDIFLADLRAYRERNLARVGMAARFPLWGVPTAALATECLGDGFRAVLTCVDGEKLPRTFAGRAFDSALLADLPPGVDPCGENGEFHTFVHDGPIFHHPVPFRAGAVVSRDSRFFADLLRPEA